MENVMLLGAGGRDFHNFNTVFRDNPSYRVFAFTAAQIPFLEGRTYPPELAGRLYPEGIPIYAEESLEKLIVENNIKKIIFSYSDISYEDLMHTASKAIALGADFLLLGPERTMLRSAVPVISVCAVRTGCGKSVITRKLAGLFKEKGIRVSVIRHPMAYCSFVPSSRFSTIEDIDRGVCTIEEREEFEPLVERGITVYAGIDYKAVLGDAEKDSEVIIWDGGNNDFPFILPDFEIVLLDALRPGHERNFYPGEVNLRRGNLLIITKTNEAKENDLRKIRSNIIRENSDAGVLEAPSRLAISNPDIIRGKKILVIEDGPTITHGGMPYGAGVSASKGIASEFADPRPYASGSIKEAYEKYPHIGPVLPAMGYSDAQIKDLEDTVMRTPFDAAVIATPVDLRRIIKINRPSVRVFYDFDIDLTGLVESFIKQHVR